MIKVIFQMLGILFVQVVLIKGVHDYNREPVKPIDFPKRDYSIKVKYDNYGNCFAFIMDSGSLGHKHAVNCSDTARFK